MDKVEVLCLFCKSPLIVSEGEEFTSGDLIECKSCGKSNDYDSVVEVAAEKATELFADKFRADLEDSCPGLFKKK